MSDLNDSEYSAAANRDRFRVPATKNSWQRYEEPIQPWKVWKPLQKEYQLIVDNPSKRLPGFMHPFISKGPVVTFGKDSPSYANYKIDLVDNSGVHRRLYFHFCKENFVIGAIGASLVGLGIRNYYLPSQLLHAVTAQKMILGKPLKAARALIFSGTQLTAGLCLKIIGRVVTGGFLYDGLKRNQEKGQVDFDKTNVRMQNAGIAGGICGLAFGIRGGLKYALLAAALQSSGSVMSELVPIPTSLPESIWDKQSK